jgi:hypothetical protein
MAPRLTNVTANLARQDRMADDGAIIVGSKYAEIEHCGITTVDYQVQVTVSHPS